MDLFDSFDNVYGDGFQSGNEIGSYDYLDDPSKYGQVEVYDGEDYAPVEDSGAMLPSRIAQPHAFGLVHVGDVFIAPDGNLHMILNYDDPLLHSQEYRCEHFDITGGNPDLVHVDGYFRDDGTYVNSHFRTAPDGIVGNNFSHR